MCVENRTQFEKLLIPIRRQLFLKLILKELQLLFLMAGACVFLLIAIASFWVVPFLNYYFLAMFAPLMVLFFIRVWLKRPGWHEAAMVYNEFVSEDRVLTAYSFLGKEGDLERLQLADALSWMKRVQSQVVKRKRKYQWFPKWLAGGVMLTLLAIATYYLVPDSFELAKKLEKDIALVKEVEKKLEEKAEKEKNPEVKKALEEAEKKLSQAKTAEEALKELEKQAKELELQTIKEKEKQKALENTQRDLERNGMANLAQMLEQKDLEAFEKELKELNDKWNELSEEQKKALSQLSGENQQLTEEQLEQLLEQIELALESPELLEQLAAAQAAIQNAGMNMQNQMISNGMAPTQMAFAPSGQQGGQPQGQPNGNGQTPSGNGQQGNGNSPGNGSGNGNGNGNGTGSGSGSGSGSGGAGAGMGSGSGIGGGAGLGQGSREMLTIPERMGGDTNIETDNGVIGEGAPGQQSEGTGPVLKGSIRPYSEVFGSYQEAYRQSTERLELPADLGDIVKNYFSTIDPNKE
jgi:hypothetical protein